jgi:hypothetical protein
MALKALTETPEEWAERTATEQGCPVKITDPAIIGQAAALIGQTRRQSRRGPR